MARKEVSVHVPVQQGFGFGVVNEQGAEPPFLWREVEVLAAIERIQGCKWASVDSETTGLTDASMPVLLSTKEIKQGSSNTLRMRTIQARIPTVNGRRGPRENLVFDADRMGPALTERVARAILSRPLFIAHNAGFDLWWARKCEGRKTMPQYVADTMLLTRALKPRLVLERAAMVEGLHDISDLPDQPEPVREAWKSLIAGGSGGSLADVVLSMFGVVLDKTYQKPHNWTGLLGFAHHTYAADDTVWADRILCQLLDISPDGDLYQAYLGVRARSAVVRMLEPQVPDLVLLRENGMPASEQIAHRYVRRKRRDLATKVAELIDIEPNLSKHRAKLSDPDVGIDEGLKASLAEAFTQRGVLLRKTAATAAPQVGEKDLRACRAAQIEASLPLFNAWVAVCRAKKASAMALDVAGFIRRGPDGRLRSLLSHGPVTGRLAAQEPNCFTGDTEILTPQGWTRFDALQDDQLVAQYHKGTISFVAPHAHIREHWTGELVHNQTGHIDLLTTPLHRCLLLSRNTGKEIVVDAQDYKEDHLQLHAASYSGGRGLALTEQEIRFLVMMQADGSWHDGGVDIKFTRQRKIDRLRELFGGEIGHSYDTKFGQTRFRFNKGNRLTEIAQTYLGEQKLFGAWVLHMTRAQLDVFVDELAHWDGLYTRKDTSICYTTTVEQNAHWVQIAYALSGKTVRVVPYRPANSKRQAWRVQGFHREFTSTTNRAQTRQAFEGMVYCVSVDSGFIMIRRGGKTMITGQCQQWPRDQLFRAICISETLPGCEDTQVLVTEHNRAFLCDVLDSVVQVGETVTVMTAWLAAMFYSTKLLDGSEKEKKRLAQLAGDTLALGRDEGWVSVLVAQASYPLLSDLSETPVTVGTPARVSAAALAQALEHTQLFEPCTKAERAALKKLVDAQFKEVIIASDFGALDVRVGAALCIRAQREMLAAAQGEAVPGITQPPEDVLAVVRDVARLLEGTDAAARLEAAQGRYRVSSERYAQQIETLKQNLDDEKISRKLFFRQRSDIKEKLLCAKLGWRLAQCLALAAARGEREYSALRDAFIAEIDIHTFTGMKLIGRDPMAEFAGLERTERKALEKKLKKELGPRRQQGKIANLSLLYGMEDAGFQEAAARNYDEHWTMQETHDIRSLWMNAYPEVELWHLWTECLCAGYVYEPSQEKEKQKATRVNWWLVRTLAGRELVARGLNAALSYQDQSSGADILGDINHRLHRDHEAIFLASINQVHDEQVFALPREHADADLEIIERVMVQEANKHTMPYGVPCAVSPACGPIWIKD